MRELNEELPVAAMAAFLGVAVLLAPLWYFPMLRSPLTELLTFHLLFCLLALLPLSRFWLPEFLREMTFWILNAGLSIYHRLERLNRWCRRQGLGLLTIPIELAFFWGTSISRWLQNSVLVPLYKLLGWLFSKKRLGVARKKQRYYAGLAAWYIEELLAKRSAEFSLEQLRQLDYLCRELRDVE